MKEEEEYGLEHENEVTSEDFKDFEDISPNTAEIRDADPSMTKLHLGRTEEVLNNLFNGDTGDFEEEEEYKPTEEEKEELEKLLKNQIIRC